MNPLEADRQGYSRPMTIAQVIAWAVGLAITLPYEVARVRQAEVKGAAAWLTGWNVDTTLFCIWLLLAPVFWFWKWQLFGTSRPIRGDRKTWFGADTHPEHHQRLFAGIRTWTLAILVAAISWGMSWSLAHRVVNERPVERFGELPPAFHDEYSYLFQAETLLASRVWSPSHPEMPELFDQMHVLNEGRFASRYFPSTGLWLAPWVHSGHPLWGQWLAGSLTAFFFFWAGRELGGNRVGFLTGLLVATSPGMGLFSNLLLAHHPTLLGLSVFLSCFLRMMRTFRFGYAFLAGVGLSFAMLARPMSAAGFALPFGVWMGWWLFRGDRTGTVAWKKRTALACGIGLPLVIGFVILFEFNQQITGRRTTTPYQQYTDLHTPRHVYGFNNRVRGERKLGPKVIENYDQWAENLTPALAMKNTRQRLIASWQWSLGIVPLAVTLTLAVLLFRRWDLRWRLVIASLISIPLLHLPYWYVGIMNWHYVFESGPMWLLLCAGVFALLADQWKIRHRPAMPLWASGFLVVSWVTLYTAEPFFASSRVERAVAELAYPRLQYSRFQRLMDRQVTTPALVLIVADPADRHIDYVTNSPSLDAPILFGRYRPEKQDLAVIQTVFPDRTLYIYYAATQELLPAGP